MGKKIECAKELFEFKDINCNLEDDCNFITNKAQIEEICDKCIKYHIEVLKKMYKDAPMCAKIPKRR